MPTHTSTYKTNRNEITVNSLFLSLIREECWFKKVGRPRPSIKRPIEEINPAELSIFKRSRNTENSIKTSDSPHGKGTVYKGLSSQLKLYHDFQWSKTSEYFWPARIGDYSPLSPDGEPLERQSKIGLDFWRWNRETAPLGYVPPLCTCKRTNDCISTLATYGNGFFSTGEYSVCDNDICRGLLYIPYSLLEIPLNRVISNGSEFATNVKVPDSTDIYCGNMKHTLILCTKHKEHEEACLTAIRESDVTPPIIYDVVKGHFLPYFKRYIPSSRFNTPTMAVEPIDSDVSDSEDYGIGQLFAVKQDYNSLSILKYDLTTKKTAPLDTNLRLRWKNTSGDDSDGCEESASLPDCNILSEENYIIYELIESFSSERRPLSFSLRSENNANMTHISNDGYEIGNINNILSDHYSDTEAAADNFETLDKRRLETLCILSTLDNFYT
ncbi:hypothetical protein BEWA_018660 [Theileria equi strain WA]|uniref:Uncharacterized protein n=1 Tax=Theileria equi strain WA TaxID=1537102 RepID=L0AVH4_THEEQ|nr:hypothetical protein BEWA_018660 [Theileria equi strain WA]AFZ79021.1 hypothetical protein BEWA_018660 [Theileria equi strain WA]|eukprot:XP_004828687.1 hypothetical protein BEWA_018660 [Theileria equi strain WA]